METNSLFVASFVNIFFHPVGCVFLWFVVSFALQKLLGLIRSHLFIFVFISITLGDGLKIFTNDATNKLLVSKIYSSCNSIQNTNNSTKNGQKTKYTFLQRWHTNSQETHEKMLNTANSQRNAHQNCPYNKIAAHSNQNVHPQSLQTIMLERVWRKENPPTLLVEM